jgi:hypothetical protein
MAFYYSDEYNIENANNILNILRTELKDSFINLSTLLNNYVLIDELKKFLAIKVTSKEDVSPSDEVDHSWHSLILETLDYFTICNKINNGKPIRHSKLDSFNQTKRSIRYNNTLRLYKIYFNEQPHSKYWPSNLIEENVLYAIPCEEPIHLFVQTLTGKTIYIQNMEKNNTVVDLKREISKKEGLPLDSIVLTYAARILENNHILSHYNILDCSTILLFYKLRGC